MNIRTKMISLLALLCAVLIVLEIAVQDDVAVAQRQSTIIQTALSELMRSTRNAHVVETVRLPDLVAQTLEIVPDACRQRLVVDTDESLRKVVRQCDRRVGRPNLGGKRGLRDGGVHAFDVAVAGSRC
jgi:hypothetical protein